MECFVVKLQDPQGHYAKVCSEAGTFPFPAKFCLTRPCAPTCDLAYSHDTSVCASSWILIQLTSAPKTNQERRIPMLLLSLSHGNVSAVALTEYCSRNCSFCSWDCPRLTTCKMHAGSLLRRSFVEVMRKVMRRHQRFPSMRLT